MTEVELFNNLGIHFQNLDGQMDADTDGNFKNQFEAVFSCKLAKEVRSVVYIWSTKQEIPRTKGKSNIIYIGKTKKSLFERHHRYAELEATELNWMRHGFIIKNYGPIKVSFAEAKQPREIEKKLLRMYFKEHLELPPLNSSG